MKLPLSDFWLNNWVKAGAIKEINNREKLFWREMEGDEFDIGCHELSLSLWI